MADVRTQQATVTRLLGSKGVSVVEVKRLPDGREFKSYFAAWVGEGHGLSIGDSARFVGELGVKKTDKNGTTYVDVSISGAQILDGSLVRGEQRGTWEQPGGNGWSS